jgi:putative flippase GtrA
MRNMAGEGVRYFAASAAAFVVDFSIYVALIRLAGVHYLLAAPVGFAFGLGAIYLLSIRWVFSERRLAGRRLEFVLFASIGLGGMALNEAVIFAGVEWIALSYELAKIVSAGAVFCFNFALRKFLLFTRY